MCNFALKRSYGPHIKKKFLAPLLLGDFKYLLIPLVQFVVVISLPRLLLRIRRGPTHTERRQQQRHPHQRHLSGARRSDRGRGHLSSGSSLSRGQHSTLAVRRWHICKFYGLGDMSGLPTGILLLGRFVLLINVFLNFIS